MLSNYKGSSRFSKTFHDAGTVRSQPSSSEYVDERNADLGRKAPPVTFEAIGVRRPLPHEIANQRLDESRSRVNQEKLWMSGVIPGVMGKEHFTFAAMVVGFVGVLVFLRTRRVI